jgi:hypothetical protein
MRFYWRKLSDIFLMSDFDPILRYADIVGAKTSPKIIAWAAKFFYIADRTRNHQGYQSDFNQLLASERAIWESVAEKTLTSLDPRFMSFWTNLTGDSPTTYSQDQFAYIAVLSQVFPNSEPEPNGVAWTSFSDEAEKSWESWDLVRKTNTRCVQRTGLSRKFKYEIFDDQDFKKALTLAGYIVGETGGHPHNPIHTK